MDWDPPCVSGVLKLKEADIAPVVSRADGIDRYALHSEAGTAHEHPHFSCDDCGQLTCLPEDIANIGALEEAWAHAVQNAKIQIRGHCPDCI